MSLWVGLLNAGGDMSFIVRAWEAPRSELIEFVRAQALDSPKATNVEAMPSVFKDYATEIIAEEYPEFQPSRWQWFAALSTTGIMAAHMHRLNSRCVIHFLQAPDAGGEIYFLDQDDNYIGQVAPESGVTVLFPAQTKHGVKETHGGTRLAVVGLSIG